MAYFVGWVEVGAYFFWKNITLSCLSNDFIVNRSVDGLDAKWPIVGPRIRSRLCLGFLRPKDDINCESFKGFQIHRAWSKGI